MDFSKFENRFRPIKERVDINNTIIEIKDDNMKVVVWQKENEKKGLILSVICHIDWDNSLFLLKPIDPADKYNMDLGEVVYIHGEKKNILFKSSPRICSEKQISVPFPKEIMVEEKREDHRVNLEFRTNQELILTGFTGRDAFPSHKDVRIYDISQNGLSFIFKCKEDPKYIVDYTIDVERISDLTINPKLTAVIVYVKETMKADKEGFYEYRAGLHFMDTISDQVYIEICLEF